MPRGPLGGPRTPFEKPWSSLICACLLSFRKTSTLGWRQARLGPRVYYFTTPGCCTAQIRSSVLSQHRVLSSRNIRPRAPCGARCMGHAIRTWSALCLAASHSQFGEGARPYLCMDQWNHPTLV